MLLLSAFAYWPSGAFSQGNPTNGHGNRHRIYVYWGWNRGFFSDSDIHFEGPAYDFTLEKVKAKDRQSDFSFRKYFHPSQLTIPQTNYGIGLYFRDNRMLSLGVDHMKYVVQQGQAVAINGTINTGSAYDGTYAGEDMVTVQPGFLELEHTDGLNYLHAAVGLAENLLKKQPKLDGKLEANLSVGLGGGVLLPRTDAKLLSFERNNEYHLAGFGLSVQTGLQVVFFRHFFLRGDLKLGFINLPSVRTTPDKADKAAQHFYFVQPSLAIGSMFHLKKNG